MTGCSNSDTERALRVALAASGFSLSEQRGVGETGVDIVATIGAEAYYIEVIGYKSSPPQRSRDFFEGFFRAISRLNQGATHCVLAVPKEFGTGLPRRAQHYGLSWSRIGSAFPELEIWLVDNDAEQFAPTSWDEWLQATLDSKGSLPYE
jgi:hypothetical protein